MDQVVHCQDRTETQTKNQVRKKVREKNPIRGKGLGKEMNGKGRPLGQTGMRDKSKIRMKWGQGWPRGDGKPHVGQ